MTGTIAPKPQPLRRLTIRRVFQTGQVNIIAASTTPVIQAASSSPVLAAPNHIATSQDQSDGDIHMLDDKAGDINVVNHHHLQQ